MSFRDLRGALIADLDGTTFGVAQRLRELGVRFGGAVVRGAVSIPGVPTVEAKDLARFRNRTVWVSNPHAARAVRKLGYRKILETSQVRQALPAPEYLMAPDELIAAVPAIRAAYEVFQDRASRALFLKLMQLRVAVIFGLVRPSLATGLLGKPAPDLYFPEDLVRAEDYSDFVDCGAYRGDTLWPVLKRNPVHRIRNYYAFEPDPHQFALLKRNIAAMKSLIGDARVETIAKALSDENGRVRFRARGDGLSRIDPHARASVPTIRLDDYLQDRPVTFFKVEAEGQEIGALLGAAHSIRKWRPFLAVTVYHEAQDLWEIPAEMKAVEPSYRLVLRHHAWDHSRSVCYGVPLRARKATGRRA